MFASKEFFMLIPCLYLGLYVFSKLADIFHTYFQKNRYQFRNYNRVVIIIMVAIVCVMATLQTLEYIFKTMYVRAKDNHEIYTLKSADYNIYFQDNGSANVEHILWLKRNKDTSDNAENVINYEFDEVNDISNIQVFVNNNEIEKNSAKICGTFTTHITNKTNKIHIYLPDKDEEIRLKINYYVKNSLSQKGDGYFTYYNKFLAHRSGLSYNTQFNGNIRFFMPKGSRYDFAAYSKDIYVEAKGIGDNIANIYFENKLQHNFSINMYRVDGYEHITWRGEYSKEFAIETRVDFSLKNPYTQQTYINYKPYSIDELKEMSQENKKEYSNILFILNILMINLFQSILPYLIVTFPLIHWYYKKKLNEYWKYMSEEK